MPKKKVSKKVDWGMLPVNTEQGVCVNDKIDPDAWKEHTDQLEKDGGGTFTARDTWKSIEFKPGHPCYDAFEWDDQEGAARYRDEQGRLMVRAIRTTVVHQEMKEYKIRAIVKANDDEGYQSMGTAVKSADTMEYQQQLALNELVRWRRRYRMLAELSVMSEQLEVIDGVIHVMQEALVKG